MTSYIVHLFYVYVSIAWRPEEGARLTGLPVPPVPPLPPSPNAGVTGTHCTPGLLCGAEDRAQTFTLAQGLCPLIPSHTASLFSFHVRMHVVWEFVLFIMYRVLGLELRLLYCHSYTSTVSVSFSLTVML